MAPSTPFMALNFVTTYSPQPNNSLPPVAHGTDLHLQVADGVDWRGGHISCDAISRYLLCKERQRHAWSLKWECSCQVYGLDMKLFRVLGLETPGPGCGGWVL